VDHLLWQRIKKENKTSDFKRKIYKSLSLIWAAKKPCRNNSPSKTKCQQEEDDVCSSCQRVIEMIQLIMCTSNNLLDEGGLEEMVEEKLGFEALEF
jgi:hypothetical protein